MRTRELAVRGAFAFTPDTFPDERGVFVSPMQKAALVDTVGLPAFPAAQASYSRSRRGVVRGIHYTLTPPGCAKYVCCPHGRVLDIVVDLRAGSPTFGRHDTVVLDGQDAQAVFLPVGVGHGFVALEEDSIVSYLLSVDYEPTREAAVRITDPALALPIPAGLTVIMSNRDSTAPTLAEAEAAGRLPDYATCQALTPSPVSTP